MSTKQDQPHPAAAYTGADFAVIAAPTNYDEQTNFFDTSIVESVIAQIANISPWPTSRPSRYDRQPQS